MDLTYRLDRSDDIPELKRLWAETAWGAFTEEMYRHYFEEAPLGRPVLCVAQEDSGRIVGEIAFLPTDLSIDGRVVRAYRPAAPILSPTVRGWSVNPMSHPVVQMYSHALQLLKDKGALVYSLPDPHWKLLSLMFPNVVRGSYPLWSIPLPFSTFGSLAARYSAGVLREWDARVDRLWEATARRNPCLVVRDARRLFWKAGPPEFEVTAVERGRDLVGLVCSKQKGDRQWLICDLLAADDEALRESLKAACHLADSKAREAEPSDPITKAAILATPALVPVLDGLGFRRDKYDFPMIIRILDDSISREAVDPSRWYLSAND
jgi:hypothetical protein